MKMKCTLGILLALTAVVPLVAADTVVLNNGSNLIGSVDSADGKQLIVKTDYADVVTIQWAQVKALTTDKPIYVVTPDKRTVSGPVTTEAANLVIHTSAGNVTVPLADVKTIRSPQQQQTYEASLHPSFIEDWKGGVNLGFALARGNSDTTNLNVGFLADRKTQNDETKSYLTSVYADNSAPGAGGVTANAILAGLSYKHDLNKKVFAFVSADYLHNELQFLDLQQIYSAGVGFHAVNTPNTTFDLFAGPNYTRQNFTAGATAIGVSPGVTRNIFGLTIGETFMHKFGALTTVNEDFTFYPELTENPGQYLFAFDAGATTTIHKWLGWQFTVSDRYVSNPPIVGTKSNDVIFATGLTVSFDTTIK
jgi:putative salt-induced outer membrane protein YdiY